MSPNAVAYKLLLKSSVEFVATASGICLSIHPLLQMFLLFLFKNILTVMLKQSGSLSSMIHLSAPGQLDTP
jgi:hypothetical protein